MRRSTYRWERCATPPPPSQPPAQTSLDFSSPCVCRSPSSSLFTPGFVVGAPRGGGEMKGRRSRGSGSVKRGRPWCSHPCSTGTSRLQSGPTLFRGWFMLPPYTHTRTGTCACTHTRVAEDTVPSGAQNFQPATRHVQRVWWSRGGSKKRI